MVLIIRESDVDAVLDMRSSVACLESAFREQSQGLTIMPDRQVMQARNPGAIVRVMAAAISGPNAFGLKALLGVPAQRDPRQTYFATLLFDPQDAHLLAIISAGRLTQLRTGGASGVATRYLSKENSDSIGLIGAGVQGFGQVEGVAAVRSLKSGFIYDKDEARAASFAHSVEERLGIALRATSRLDDLYGTDIVCTATTALTPILFGDNVKAGTHVNAIGSNAPNRQEVHESVLVRSKVYVDRREQALKETGDLVIPIKNERYKPDDIAGELCDVVTGKVRGRTADSDITLFKSVGIAIEDIAVARAVFERARERGLGVEIDFQS
jgi:ornithine cyclodeaminase/alanine dehydrogenase-like protein (mu-crystallin family)